MSDLQEDKKEYLNLLEKLQNASFADTVSKSPEWEILRSACSAVVDRAYKKLATIPPKRENALEIMNYQMVIEFYENIVQKLIDEYKTVGKEAYETSVSRGWADSIARHLKSIFKYS